MISRTDRRLNMINVSRPFLPPREEFYEYLDGIWSRNYLTNNGPLVRELEQRLGQYLGVENILFLANGTLALQMAIKAMSLQGEIITTPFSYIATISSAVWENCTPVFVDIEQDSLNIDSELIERSITSNTSAILATHVFGNPCNIGAIEDIAESHGLKVIYDAAHCFSTEYKGTSVLNYGDISCISFHATKLFHTVEGGAVIARTADTREKLFHMRNFGHAGFYKYKGVGINAKNSEFHAAMGLCNLRHIDSILDKYRFLHGIYDRLLDDNKVKRPVINKSAGYNYSYYPAVFRTEKKCLEAIDILETAGINPRRYFYPPLNKIEYVADCSCPVAEDIAARILCLPLFFDLEEDQVARICECVNQV
jgi:dTDP-4-amino-4,6-dideoxygalactose transaminase